MAIDICDVRIDNFSLDQVVESIVTHVLSGGPPAYVVTPNAQHILLLQQDRHFRKIYHDAFLAVPDGVSLLWAARFLGAPLKGRVNGTDLFKVLCEVSAEKNLRIFFLGGRPGAAVKAKEILQTHHTNLKIVGTHCPPYGFESVPTELDLINQKIEAAIPDILFVGLGAPKQEYWIYDSYKKLSIPISIGIGVSFELVANMVPRAPVFMQNIGMEWLFRLMVEPYRLWKRYIFGNPLFIWLVLRQRLRKFMFK